MELVFAVPKHHHQLNAAVSRPHDETPTPLPLTDLVAALDRATQAAKILSTTSSSAAAAAIASLRDAHQMIGSLLASTVSQPSNGDGDEPMSDQIIVEEEPDGGFWSRIVEDVGEGMRDCVLQTKRRRKRRVPLSWPPGRVANRVEEIAAVDSVERRRSAMDLVFQFHA